MISVRGRLKLGIVTVASVHCFLYEIMVAFTQKLYTRTILLCFNFNGTTTELPHSRADTDIKLLLYIEQLQ